MNNTSATPIMSNQIPTREADASVILAQIGPMTLASVGGRDYVDLGVGVHFFVGKGRTRKVVVKLTPADLYAVETVQMHRDFTFESIYFLDGVPAAALPQVVLTAAAAR